jgi:hypothetical protein
VCARGRHSTPAAYLHVIMKLAHRQQQLEPAPAPTATRDLSTTPAAAAAAAGSIDEPATGLSRLTLLLRPFHK